jgi:transcriptional antiterminator RfaH
LAYWAVARTLVRREAVAADALDDAGFQIFAPRVRTGPGHSAPLFAGYLFVHIDTRWRAADRTHGVVGLVKAGDQPARCPDEEISKLMKQVDQRGFVRLRSPPKGRGRALAPGAGVRITSGPFRGLSAIHTGMTAHQRELVLIRVLGRQTRVEINSTDLEVAS